MKLIMSLILLCSVNFCWADDDSDEHPALAAVALDETTKRAPLSMAVLLLDEQAAAGDSVTVAIKAHIMEGWHAYAYDPTQVFKVIEHEVSLPESLELDGDWDLPGAEPYDANPDILIYHDDLLFQQNVKVKDGTESGEYNIDINISYQVCDAYTCLAPKRVKEQLVLTVK